MGTASISLVEEEINLIFLRLQKEKQSYWQPVVS